METESEERVPNLHSILVPLSDNLKGLSVYVLFPVEVSLFLSTFVRVMESGDTIGGVIEHVMSKDCPLMPNGGVNEMFT